MRDLGSRMAELKFEAPLAKLDEADDWAGCDYISSNINHNNNNNNNNASNDNNNNLNLNLKLNLKDPLNSQQQQAENNKMRLLEEAVRDVQQQQQQYYQQNSKDKDEPLLLTPNCNTLLTATASDQVAMEDYNTANRNEGEGLTVVGGNANNEINFKVLNMNFNTNTSSNGGRTFAGSTETVDTFSETFGGSLEDLVNTFDEKITKCFGNYEENIENLAPVQVRSQEEIMNECQ